MDTVVFYISGHGFGHASRSGQVIRELRDRGPETRILARSLAPEWFLREQAGDHFSYQPVECDTGVLQSDSLTIRYLETLKAYREFSATMEARVKAEVDFLRQVGAKVVFGDIPPLAFESAQAAQIPSLGMTNFSWDWIYGSYTEKFPEFSFLIDKIRLSYEKTGLLLKLPFSGGLDAFPRQFEIPLVARASRFSKPEVRRILGLDESCPAVLVSFGGFSLGSEYYDRIARDPSITWLASERVGLETEGIRNFSRQELADLGLGYPDLVRAVDIVVTKPGYGILSECIANRTRMLYTNRGDFREYPLLVKGAQKNLPCLFISQEELRGGKLTKKIDELLEQPDEFVDLPLNGAEEAAKQILKRLEDVE